MVHGDKVMVPSMKINNDTENISESKDSLSEAHLDDVILKGMESSIDDSELSVIHSLFKDLRSQRARWIESMRHRNLFFHWDVFSEEV